MCVCVCFAGSGGVSGDAAPGLEVCLCVVKGEKVGGMCGNTQEEWCLGRGGRDEELIKQGLFLGGTLGCGSNLGGTRSSERKIKRSGRPGEGRVCLEGNSGLV